MGACAPAAYRWRSRFHRCRPEQKGLSNYGLCGGDALRTAPDRTPPCRSVRQIKAGAFGGTRVQVSAGSGHGSVPERGLDEMDRGAAIEGVAGVGMTHPMGRDLLYKAGLLRGGIDDPPHLGRI